MKENLKIANRMQDLWKEANREKKISEDFALRYRTIKINETVITLLKWTTIGRTSKGANKKVSKWQEY